MSHPPQNNWPPQGGPQQGWQSAQQWGGAPGLQGPHGGPQATPGGPPPGYGGPQPQQWGNQGGGKPSGGSKLPWILLAVSAVGILLVLAIVFLGDGPGSGESPGGGGQTQPGGTEGGGTEGGDGTESGGGAEGGGSEPGGVEPGDPGSGGDYVAASTPALPDSFGAWSRNTSTDGVGMGEPYTDGSRGVGIIHEASGGGSAPPGAPDEAAGEWSHGPGVLCLSSSQAADALHQCVLGYADGGVVVFMSTDRSAIDDAVPAFLAATR